MVNNKCPICEITKHKDKLIYEDQDIVAYFDNLPYVKGQLVVAPKHHYVIMEQVPNKILSRMFYVSSLLSSLLYAALKCGGTNILINNGVLAGQNIDHFTINIIPRYKDDNLDLKWEPKKVDRNYLSSLAEDIRMNFIIGDDPSITKYFERDETENKSVNESISENDVTKQKTSSYDKGTSKQHEQQGIASKQEGKQEDKNKNINIIDKDYEKESLNRIP